MPLEFETKSDRELLLLTANKVNEIVEKLDVMCGQIKANTGRLTVLKEKVDHHDKWLKGITGGLVATITGIIIAFLRHIGLN